MASRGPKWSGNVIFLITSHAKDIINFYGITDSFLHVNHAVEDIYFIIL